MRQRLRIIHSITPPLCYASHLDRMAVWTRAARRAGLPLRYSEGYHPRPRLQFGAALPVGFHAGAEILDLWLEPPVDPQAAQQQLERELPEGLGIVSVEDVDVNEPSLPKRVQSADYAATVESTLAPSEIERRVDELLAAESLPRERRGRAYDLRPLVEQLEMAETCPDGVVLEMRLATRSGATGRPEEVLAELGLDDGFFRICRVRLLLTEPTT